MEGRGTSGIEDADADGGDKVPTKKKGNRSVGNGGEKSARTKNPVDNGTTQGDNGRPQAEATLPEKLSHDVILPPLWKRVIFHVFPHLYKSEWWDGVWSVRYQIPKYSASSLIQTSLGKKKILLFR